MIDLFDDNVDIEFTCSKLDGIPVLVLQATGPTMSAAILTAEYKKLDLRFATDDPTTAFTTFLLFDGKDIHKPILACDIDNPLRELMDWHVAGKDWILFGQVMSEGQKVTRMWMVRKDQTTEAPSLIPRWPVTIM